VENYARICYNIGRRGQFRRSAAQCESLRFINDASPLPPLLQDSLFFSFSELDNNSFADGGR